MKKKFLIILLSVFIVAAFLLIKNYIGIWGIVPPSKNVVEKLYYVNETELKSICAFLQEEQYTDIRIELSDTENVMICFCRNSKGGFDRSEVELSNSNIVSGLKKLKKSGFIRILKEHGYIFFQSWGSFGESVGLMNSQGKKPKISEINTVYNFIEEIGQTEWYYYKEKFE